MRTGHTAQTGLLDTAVDLSGPADLVAEVLRLTAHTGPGAGPVRRLEVVDGRVLLDGELQAAAEGDDLLATVLACLNRAAVEGCRDLAVHAGVVARGGVAAAFPAASGAGKSTLTAACVLAGLDYVSDEALVLDEGGGVRGYAKPLALGPWSLSVLGLPGTAAPERLLLPAELGAEVAAPGLRLGHVVEPVRRPGPAALVPRPRAEGAALLLRMAFNHWLDPVRALRRAAAPGAQAWTLEYDDPREGAALVAGLLDG